MMNRISCLLIFLSLGCSDKKIYEYKYFPDGEIKEQIEIQNGLATGIYKTYYPNGNLKSFSYQKDSKLDSLSITYFEDGSLQSQQLYKNGQRNGECQFYYKNGNIAYSGKYKDGLELGRHLEYYENDSGKIWNEFEYLIVNGKVEQTKGLKYDEAGNVIESSNWLKFEEVHSETLKRLRITVINPVYDSLNVTIGDYDDQFVLRDSSSLKTIWGSGHFLEIDVDSANPIRGYVNDYKVIDYQKDGSFQTLSSYIYFEHRQ